MTGKLFTDSFLPMIPAILPELRRQFALSLTKGVAVIFALQLAANLIQLLTGHLRSTEKRPLISLIGLALVGSLSLVGLVPGPPIALPIIIILAVLTGCGDGMYNPEGLRAIHRLHRIPPALGSSLFLSSGFAGFAFGAWASAFLLTRFGLKGLLILPLFPLASLAIIVLLRVRLFVEQIPANENAPLSVQKPLPLWPVVVMATIAAISSNIISWLTPTRLNELGFELTFGGFAVTMFCLGAMFGSFFWAAAAHKFGDIPCSIIAVLLGTPLTILYLLNIEARAAVWLLFALGFCSLAGYSLMVTMARRAGAANLGRRISIIIGGVWGIACLAMMALGPVADRFGVKFVLNFAPLGYLLAALVGLAILLHTRSRRPATISSPSQSA